jgi:hypothetical protein
MARKKNKILFVYISDEDNEYLRNRAKENVSTIADYVRTLIAEDKKKHKKAQ